MEKVYLLLRNNTESGPFSYPHLINQSLVSSDLIWIEGESTAWMNPAELAEFQKKKERKIDVGPVSQVVPIASNVPPPPKLLQVQPTIETVHVLDTVKNNSKSEEPILLPGEQPIEFRVHKKGVKLVSLDQLAAAAFIALVLSTAWYGRHQFLSGNTQIISSVTPASFVSERAFAGKKDIVQSPVISADTTTTSAQPNFPVKSETIAVKKYKPKSRLNHSAEQSTNLVTTENNTPAITIEPTELVTEPVKEEPKPEVVEPVQNTPPETSHTDNSEVKKKKPFGKAIKGIFRKKNQGVDSTTS